MKVIEPLQDFTIPTSTSRHSAPSRGGGLTLRPSTAAPRERHFLIISAPFGPFATGLARTLRASKARVSRVALNAGDALDWRAGGLIPYRGKPDLWRGWLAELLVQNAVTDVVCYGDSKHYDRIAIDVARRNCLKTHILEQGYFRPHWVTLESQGVNSSSSLPRDPEWYRDHPAAEIVAPFVAPGHSVVHAVWNISLYHLAVYVGSVAFPHFKAGYEAAAWKQAVGHTLRFVQQRSNRTPPERAGHIGGRGQGPLYLALLQRPGDSQLWLHSDFKTIPSFAKRVIESFAKFAPKDATLLFRPHPLDPGLNRWDTMIAEEAMRFDISNRVEYSGEAQLHEILPIIAGAVCVNSTAGLAAVEFGRPTVVLGRAIYDMPGLTHQDGLDSFWSQPTAPDAKLYTAFRNVVMAATQVNGNYATAKGRALAAPEIARRLLQSHPTWTARPQLADAQRGHGSRLPRPPALI
jgi:capsular polysaccharide export protein